MSKQRIIPNGYKEYSVTELHAVYTNLEQPHNPKAIFFTGKQSHRTWWISFSSIERMKEKIENTIASIDHWELLKKQRKLKKAEALKNMDSSVVKIGDIYHWRGGYNCTKNAYIKVIGVAGKNKFEVVELDKKQVSGDWMNGEVAPVINSGNISESFIVKAIPRGWSDDDKNIILRDTRRNMYHDEYYKWEGKPNWENCD